jgi:hypothetical protein
MMDAVGPVVTSQDPLAAGPQGPEQALESLAQLVDAGVDPDLGVGPARWQYVSPEQIMGRTRGPRSDVYVLSAFLYRCLTGAVPFPRGRGRAVLFWHLHGPRPRPTAVQPALPPAIDGVIARGMATDPDHRPPTPAALVEEARLALGVDPVSGRRAPEAVAAQPRPAAKRRWPLVLVGALAAAAGVAGFVVAGTFDDAPRSSSRAGVGQIQLTAPPHWRRSVERADVSGLELDDALVLTPPGSADARLVAGVTNPTDAVAALTGLQATPPAGELVALDGTQARRYSAPGVLSTTALYLAPMDRGVAATACVADSASAASFIPRCDRVAASLGLVRGRFIPVGATAGQAAREARVFERLNAARSTYRAQRWRSRTAGDVARAARALAGAHAREARALRSLEFTGIARPGGRALVGAVAQAAAAYRSLARAAGNRDRDGYGTARRAALAADDSIGHALRMLRLVGYAG